MQLLAAFPEPLTQCTGFRLGLCQTFLNGVQWERALVGTGQAEQQGLMGGHTGGTKCLLGLQQGLRLGGESV